MKGSFDLRRFRLQFAVLLLLQIAFSQIQSQTDSSSRSFPEVVQLHGYVKNMQTFQMADLNYVSQNNLIHNRLNFRIYPIKSITAGLEIRTRFFTGDQVNRTPGYASLVDMDPGIVDLSWAWVNKPGLVAVTKIDRGWVRWSNDMWDVTAGRQRINYGITTFWNSNDLFNTFNLADFDYEERPGSDAIRVQRYFGKARSIDLAIAPSQFDSTWIGSLLYRFNYRTYDFQVISGWWNEDIALGVGWAGNLKNAGFKGEITLFQPQQKLGALSQSALSMSTSIDYVFAGNLYMMGGILYNSSGADSTLNLASLSSALGGISLPSAKNLMPTKYSTLLSVSKPINPLLSGSMVGIYAPGTNLLFLMPSLNMAIASNWEFAVFGQSSFLSNGSNFRNYGTSVFARLKWGF